MEGRVRGAPPGGRRVGGRAVVVWLLTFVALLATPAAIADPPGWDNVPGDQTVEATGFGWCSRDVDRPDISRRPVSGGLLAPIGQHVPDHNDDGHVYR